MPSEPDHHLLRRYAAARDRRDLAEATRIWEDLALNNFDRVKQVVRGFRFPGGQRLPVDEHDDATSEAFMRVLAMGANFRGREVGRFRAALVTCVKNSTMDYGRKELRHKRHAGGSLDAGYDDGGDGNPHDSALAAYDAELRARQEDAEEGEQSRLEAEGTVAIAIDRIENDNYREALELTYVQKLTAEEIADQLGISTDNVYARRSRGVKELEKILRELRS